MTVEGKYKVGGIGIGRAGTGRTRAYAVHPLCEVVAVAESDPVNLELATKRFGVPGYVDSSEMFNNHDIDIVVASLPVRANHDVVLAAAEAGVKAIVTEKPLTARLSEADEMVQACKSGSIQFASGLLSKNRMNHWVAREMIQAGEIGEVHRINVYDSNTQGGCHGINLARHFSNDSEVDFVIGWTKGDPFSDYEDAHSGRKDLGFQAIGGYIRFENGIEVFSSFNPVGWRGFEVVGTKGILFKSGVSNLKLHLMKLPFGSPDIVDFADFQEVNVPDTEPSDRSGENKYDSEGWAKLTDGMVRSTEAIVEALETGQKVKLTTGEDLRKALEICIAMRESARQQQVPVSLPIEDRRLVMYPQNTRWNYKKEIMGEAAYMDALANLKKG